jgi:NAD(P)-dependent dehydrogenase (short-subunit alcohol dehydrogenase family)
MAMNSVIVTGANRGIGYGLVKQLLTTKVDHLFATYRQVERSQVDDRR